MRIFGQHDENTLRQLETVAERAERVALMADGHLGYVMPIGGVAAYRDQVSVVGVGFDIACLAEGTPVTTANGYTLPIEAATAGHGVVCWDGTTVRQVSPHLGTVARGVRDTLHVVLANGRRLCATADHEIRTPGGWKPADELGEGDVVACVPFIGLPYAPPAPMPELDVQHAHARQELSDRGLLPLDTADARFPALLRVLGYVCGDGHLTGNGKRTSLYVYNDRDAADLRDDLELLGFNPGEHRRRKAEGLREEILLYADSVALHALLATLGAPVGKKCWPAEPMPWLFEQPAWVRAHYLSAFASAEMMTPRVHPNGTVPNLQLKQSGTEPHAIHFVARLLRSLGFDTSVAPSGKPYNGRTSWVVQILGGQREQLRFIEEVGFCRSVEKRVASAVAASVAWQGEALVRNRDAAKASARTLRSAGTSWREAVATVSDRFGVTPGFAYHSFYDDRGQSRRLPGDATVPQVDGEVSWVPVVDVSPAGPVAVYDLVTGDPAHSFVACGIAVHNCGNAAIRTDLTLADLAPNPKTGRKRLEKLADEIAANVSFGVGRKNRSDDAPVDDPLFGDAAWDALPANERGNLREKARGQLGTVASGNHYVDVFADEADAIWVGVHFGSRGFGHTVASGFLALGQGARWRDRVPEKEILLDLGQPLGHDYWALMELAGQYAYAGREWVARKVVQMLGGREVELVHNHHNFAWKETHLSPAGEPTEYVLVRKGATPAFPGQKGFIGGSMGDDAVIVQGTEADPVSDAETARMQQEALYSTVHGAGRVMSRTAAAGKRKWKTGEVISPGRVSPEMMRSWVDRKGVILRGGGLDESPHVYRRLPEVLAAQGSTVQVLHTLRPLIVVMAGADEFDPYKD